MGIKEEIQAAGTAMKNGGIAVFPTETVYGIGVAYNQENAYKTLVNLKKRPPEKPFSMMFASLEDALPLLDVDERRKKLMAAFLPGQVTFLCRAKKGLPHQCDLGTGIVGVRVPSSETAMKVMKAAGCPCLVTSANLSGMKTALTLKEAKAYFPAGVDAFVGGECTSKVATTIIDLTGDEPKLVRQGEIKLEDIDKVWRNEQ